MIKKISIVGTPNDTRDIGAEAQNVIVSYDASGNIIPDITATGVVVDHTASVAQALTNTTPDDHADPTDKYGPGDATNYGHIKLGTGLERNGTTGATDVKYGTTAGTAAAGNDSRLSDDRKNPNAVTFTDGTNSTTYDGSATATVDYSTVGAAPKNHASSTTDYGVASKNNFGHVKIGDGISVQGGVISIAGGGGAGHIVLTQAQYDALPAADKADPDKYYFISDADINGNLLPFLTINSDSGAAVTVTSPSGTTTAPTVVTATQWKYVANEFGTYTVTSVLSGVSKNTNVVVDATTEYIVNITQADPITINTGVDLGTLGDTDLHNSDDGQTIIYSSSAGGWVKGPVIHYTSAYSCIVGDTTVTISDNAIHTTSEIKVQYENASESFIYYTTVTTEGQCVITFPALTEATDIRLKVIND